MRMMTLGQFARLAEVSGFEGLSESMDELVTHGVLMPIERDGESLFYPLQLISLSRYAAKARVWAHLWHEREVLPPEIKVITEHAAHMTRLLGDLHSPTARPPTISVLRELLVGLNESLDAINPFGELSAVLGLIRPSVLDSMRGDARLYVEVLQSTQSLRIQTDALDSMRVTQDMPAPAELLASSAPTSPHLKTPDLPVGDRARGLGRPVVSTRVTAEMDAIAKPISTREPEVPKVPEMPEVLEAPKVPEVSEVSEELIELDAPIELDESIELEDEYTPLPDEDSEILVPEQDEVLEPIEQATEASDDAGSEEPSSLSKPNPFVRDPSQSTSNTQDLQRRLEALRHLDGRTSADPGKTSSLAQKAIALSKARESEQPDDLLVEMADPAPSQPPAIPTMSVQTDVDSIEEVSSVSDISEISEIEDIDVADDEEISIELNQESPLVLDDDEMEDIFGDDSRTMVLDSNDLKNHALADAEHSSDAQVSSPAHDEAEWKRQIQELNAKREAYMKDQNWSGLVTLYENGVELFGAGERQQVYLTLAKLYELKIKDTARALENMALAFELGGEEAVLRKIIDALRRLGNGPTRPALMAWVEAQLGSGQWDFAITESLQRMRAGLLHETGDAQRGFLMYASFVADAPDRAANDSGLDFLEKMAEGVDATELYELYDELIEQTIDRTLLYHLNSRAGFFALQREDMAHAVIYLENALELDPAQEQLFHVLSQVYEEDARISSLVVLYERRLRAVTGATQESLHERLEVLRKQEHTQHEACREDYALRLESSPQDDVLLECMMRSFLEQEKYIEGYAFLNRHLEKVTAIASRVRALQTLSTLALQHLDSPEEAQVHLEEALELGGARKSLLERLIMISLDMEEWSKVLLYIERLTGELAAEMSNEEQVRWLLAGVQAAQSLELVDKEKSFLQRTLQIMPEHEQARQALAELS